MNHGGIAIVVVVGGGQRRNELNCESVVVIQTKSDEGLNHSGDSVWIHCAECKTLLWSWKKEWGKEGKEGLREGEKET
jgi:hypothetical protein